MTQIKNIFSEFFRLNIGHVVLSISFVCGLVYSQAKQEERVALLDARAASDYRETKALVLSMRSERVMQMEMVGKRLEVVEARQLADLELIREIRTLTSRITDLDRRVSELRDDVRKK